MKVAPEFEGRDFSGAAVWIGEDGFARPSGKPEDYPLAKKDDDDEGPAKVRA